MDVFEFFKPIPPNRLMGSTTKKPLTSRRRKRWGLVQDYQVGTAIINCYRYSEYPSFLSHCSICLRTLSNACRSICLTRSALNPVLSAICCNVNVCSSLASCTILARAASAVVFVLGMIVLVLLKSGQVRSTITPRDC